MKKRQQGAREGFLSPLPLLGLAESAGFVLAPIEAAAQPRRWFLFW
jgi:hypothetical protein